MNEDFLKEHNRMHEMLDHAYMQKRYWQMLTDIVDLSEGRKTIPEIVNWIHVTYDMDRNAELVKLITDTLYESYCEDWDNT